MISISHFEENFHILSVEAFFKVPYHCTHMHSLFFFLARFSVFTFQNFVILWVLEAVPPGLLGGKTG